jgi:enoyl-CoA hydratase/carnithine racemase
MSTQSVLIECEGPVATMRLNRGTANPLNMEIVRDLSLSIARVRDRADIRCLILTSTSEKFFSIGFDIPQLIGASESEFAAFFHEFNRMCLTLYSLPKPTVAAITGHAVAGGCILSLCCDYRFIAAGRKLIGLNEIKLGVPLPYVADCVLRSLVGFRNARDIVDTGEFYLPDAALKLGLVDAVVSPDQLLTLSTDKAKLLGGMPGRAFELIKRDRVQGVEKEIRAKLEEKEQSFIECWYSEPARDRLKEALAKYQGE